jgi:hypothetical protein
MGCGLVNGWTAVDPALAMTAAVADRPATKGRAGEMVQFELAGAGIE